MTRNQTFHPKKKYILGLGPGCGPKPKTKIINQNQTQTYLSVKNFKRFFISIPKCIELNSELVLVNIYFFGGKNLLAVTNCN